MSTEQIHGVQIFFFPFVGGGHFIPMIDLARLFASHGVKSTIITIPAGEAVIQKSITRDQQYGLPIDIHTIPLSLGQSLNSIDMSAPPMTDTLILKEPLKELLINSRPDCIVADSFHRWVADLVDELGVPRIVFNGNCCFSRCCEDVVRHQSPHKNVNSDSELFVIPDLPDKIELMRSQLPIFARNGTEFPGKLLRAEQNCFGHVVNSFYELEPAYVDHYRTVMGKKAWVVGPVSLCNRNVEDKAERGQKAAIDEHSCLNWLNSKKPNSVLYISFGSVAHLSSVQIHEIASGIEASGHQFIWVVGKILDNKSEGCFPEGFEEKIKNLNNGLIIKGWAPQLLILEHESIGGFMTHCGWNSTLEGVSAGVSMITWPLSAEQFYNEKLVVDVLKIGIKVGSEEWASWNMERKQLVGREMVKEAVVRLMGGGGEAAEMRRRAKELAKMAKRAVEHGGSSFNDVVDLIRELIKSRKQ